MKLLRIVFFLSISTTTMGQNATAIDSSTANVPKLQMLIDAAQKNWPLLKAKHIEALKLKAEIKLEKRTWSDYLFVEGAANYGVFDQFVLNEFTSEQAAQTGLLSKAEQVRYYYGLGIKMPIGTVLKRKKKVDVARGNLDIALQEGLEIEREIEQLIVEMYYNLLFYSQSAENFYSVYKTLQIASVKAEKDLLGGAIELDDYASLHATLGKAHNDYLKAKSNFHVQHKQLQTITGLKF